MNSWKKFVGLLAIILMIGGGKAWAQDHYVQGKVVNITDGGKPFTVGTVNLYFTKSQKEAREVARNLKKDHHYYDTKVQEMLIVQPNENGDYACEEAYEDGFIVVDYGMDNCPIYAIMGKDEVNMEVAVEGEKLEEVEIVAKMREAPVLEPTAPTLIGDQMFFTPNFVAQGKKTDRIIFQTYVTTCFSEVDTILTYFDPILASGEQFSLTQERRMSYVPERDTLYAYVDTTIVLDGERTIFSRDFQFTMPDPHAYYQLKMTKVTQQYPGIVETIDTVACKCQREDPLQYFQFGFASFPLEPLKYRPSSQMRARNDADTVSLTFLVGSTRIDPNNPKNETEWNKIVDNLKKVIETTGSRIQEYEIVGVASPEGGYQSNLNLAGRRANYAIQQLTNQGLLKSNTPTKWRGEVAGWDQVAALMEQRDPVKAAEIADIVANYPTIDAQSAQMRRLPYYRMIADSILPKLRCVRTSCKYIVRRNLTSTEIYELYKANPDFKFEPAEYWSLIQSIKDPQEKMAICLRALEENQFDTPLRPFAANELIRQKMDLAIVDTNTLKEFIFPQYMVNQQLKVTDSYTKIINPGEILGNQVYMYLLSKRYYSAASLVRRLENIPDFRELSMLVACLNGYYAEDEEVLNANLNKDVVNTIILHLAMGAKQNKGKVSASKQRYHNVEALKMIRQLNDLPAEKQALAYYLKAVIYNRLDLAIAEANVFTGYLYENKAADALVKCFELDESFIRRCQGDAYIRDSYQEGDVRERDIFDEAVARYYKWKDGDGDLGYTVLDDMVNEFGIGAPDPTAEEVEEWGLTK